VLFGGLLAGEFRICCKSVGCKSTSMPVMSVMKATMGGVEELAKESCTRRCVFGISDSFRPPLYYLL
jgi:hypothetical protein